MKLKSTREKIWNRTLLRKSDFEVIEKETLMDVFINLQATENGLSPLSGNFHKILTENHCDYKQIRSDQ